MSEAATTYTSGFLLALVATILMLLIVPAASAASRRLKPGWRAWVWPLIFAGLALTSLSSALAAMLNIEDTSLFLVRAVYLLAGMSFTFLTVNALYRAVPEAVARRFSPLLWAVYLLFTISALVVNSFVTLLVYDAVCSVLVFLVYSTLYARDRDQAADAIPIMVGTGLILVADLVASFVFRTQIGPVVFNELLLFNLLEIIALVFFFRGASASYGVKYDLQRHHERLISNQ